MHKLSIKKTTSKGIVIGRAFLYKPAEIKADTKTISQSSVQEELGRFKDAVIKAKEQIAALSKISEIFMAHLDVADDPVLHDSVEKKITKECKNAELSVEETSFEIVSLFETTGNKFLMERAHDVCDVCIRIIKCLKGLNNVDFHDITDQVILVAHDLKPSDTASLNKEHVLGMITASGGETSHVAIMARNLDIPAIVGVEGIDDIVSHGSSLILDAVDGTIILDPDGPTIEEYKSRKLAYDERKLAFSALKGLPATTLDGHTVGLSINVGSIRDVQNSQQYGINKVGLMRSEFLYMEGTNFPTEDEQVAAYKASVQIATGGLIVRTMDIGGDKDLPYFQLQVEENPFLGFRGIRLSLGLPDLFKTQLRAILRASAFGKIRILYPMITTLEELKAANAVLETAKKELEADNIAFDSEIQKGVMIETPAAVLIADELAKEADYFSIGSNDLTQYVLVVDRGNLKVAALYDPFNPAVLRAIKMTIDAGHRNNIKVHLCGAMAGNENAIPILLGLGLDDFSMSGSLIPEARFIIRNTDYSKARVMANHAVGLSTGKEVRDLLDRFKES
ncbi:MAG: phosphoenolpyruvate--protein phosphotransferase [Deltaproteobacteria bacterium]|jgi:phosphotransferase system enzyme I (PtsI)|nr:phosphoenolpyruvate--protein phosphotransferase [Deltaproteobacteria bacterium]